MKLTINLINIVFQGSMNDYKLYNNIKFLSMYYNL